jgi:hypothetical protein
MNKHLIKLYLYEFADDLDRAYRDYLYYPIRTFFYRIGNLIKWFPVIWRDLDWDYSHVYDILEFKLERMHKAMSKSLSSRDRLEAQKIMLCVRLLNRLKNDYYTWEHLDYVSYGHEISPSKDVKNSYVFNMNLEFERFDEYIAEHLSVARRVKRDLGLEGDPNGLEFKEELVREISIYNQERARRILFKILEVRIESWWI